MSNLRLSYLQKVGGIFVQAIPPTQKSGGGGDPPPPPGFTPVTSSLEKNCNKIIISLLSYYCLVNRNGMCPTTLDLFYLLLLEGRPGRGEVCPLAPPPPLYTL